MTDKKDELLKKPGRRDALKIIATSGAVVPVLGTSMLAEAQVPAAPKSGKNPAGKPSRSLFDPDFKNPRIHWDLVLSEPELATLKYLANIIIPKDDVSPGAGDLDAQDFINEWVSAPYNSNKRGLVLIRGGLVWLNSESEQRFNTDFLSLSSKQAKSICDEINWLETAKPDFRSAARFFAKVRDLTATAFYTTQEGMDDIGYIGNIPMAKFDGPPLEVLSKLGLEKYAKS